MFKPFSYCFIVLSIMICCSCAASSAYSQSDAVASVPLSAYPKKTGNPYVIGGITYYPLDSVDEFEEVGVASWYGPNFHGKKTANGETYDMLDMTAAHKTLPMPTYVQVENLENGKVIVVRINDRGPFSKGRIIDLSKSAAEKLDMLEQGTAKVKVTLLSQSKDHLRTEGIDVDLMKGRFAVQIGAFTEISNANRVASNFDTARVEKFERDGKIFNRVFVTGFTSRQSAESAMNVLSIDFPGAFVVAE